jgi:hypothetical protein
VLPVFNRVALKMDGQRQACSLKTAIFELKRCNKTLADITLVDIHARLNGSRSRQVVAIQAALLASGLPDPVFDAAKGRGNPFRN